MNHFLFFPLLALALSVASGSFAFADPPCVKLPTDVETFLDWLPADTETLMVGHALPESRTSRRDWPRWSSFAEAALSLPNYITSELMDERLRTELSGMKVVVTVHGARGFRLPASGLGRTSFAGAEILRVTSDETEITASQVFERLAGLASRMTDRMGIEIAEFDRAALFEEGPNAREKSSVYVSLPQSDVLVFATDLNYLEEVLDHRGRCMERKAFPRHLRYWPNVDVQFPVWAVRDFQVSGAETSESSPLNPKSVGIPPIDPKAQAFTFSFDPDKGIALARYFSGSDEAQRLIAFGLSSSGAEEVDPAIVPLHPGVVEATLPIMDGRDYRIFHLILMHYLGHGIFP